MNIWDSVHRGLDKASKEAGRIAKGQRLRSQIEKLSRQINTQEGTLLYQVMDLFTAGKLTQGELLPLCQELMTLHQQLSLAQNELQALQSQEAGPPQVSTGQAVQTANMPASPTDRTVPVDYTPPAPIYPTFDRTMPAVPPPPPPLGVEQQLFHAQETVLDSSPIDGTFPIINSQQTILDESVPAQQARTADGKEISQHTPGALAAQNAAQDAKSAQYCPKCNTKTLPGYLFCHICGTALLKNASDYQETVRATSSTNEQDKPTRAEIPPGEESVPTIRNEPPLSQAHTPPLEKDRGQ
jgi:hypothetical protein